MLRQLLQHTLALLVLLHLIQTDRHFELYLRFVVDFPLAVLLTEYLQGFVVDGECLLNLTLKSIAIGESDVAEEGGFGQINGEFEVLFGLVVEIHVHVDLAPKTDGLLKVLVLPDALTHHLQTSANVT